VQGIKKLEPTTGWEFLEGGKNANGELFGGCIEVLNFINGTDFWPKKSFWKNKILFIETSEEKPSPDYVKYTLRNFGEQGIFDKINGLMVGRARDYSLEEKKQLKENINLVVKKEFGKEFPIVTNMDFGHTDPQIILPLGMKASINSKKQEVKLLESPFIN
jgi:muramoyltetrapeptide carboxypeptidase LdcA involved in peptidoglycan recycling